MGVPTNTSDGARADEALLEPLRQRAVLHFESGDMRLPLVVSMEQVISPTLLLGVVLDIARVGAPAETHAAGVNCIKGSSMQVN